MNRLHRNVIENGDLTQTTPHKIENDLSSFPDEYRLVIIPSVDAEGQDGLASVMISGVGTDANLEKPCKIHMAYIHFENQVWITPDTYKRVDSVETIGWTKGTFDIIIARVYPK